jgi:hypothetical protein
LNTTRTTDPLRLIAAADSVLFALGEVAASRGEPWPYPSEFPAAVAPLADFTRVEIEEATAFLIRGGILEAARGGA